MRDAVINLKAPGRRKKELFGKGKVESRKDTAICFLDNVVREERCDEAETLKIS